MIRFVTDNEKMTFEAGCAFGARLKGGAVIAIDGDLGAGKTVFARGIAAALCVEGHVVSPSYTIINEYEGKIPFYHFDLYRLNDADELLGIGFYDYLESAGVCAIEWASKFKDELPSTTIWVKINRIDETKREITIDGCEL